MIALPGYYTVHYSTFISYQGALNKKLWTNGHETTIFHLRSALGGGKIKFRDGHF